MDWNEVTPYALVAIGGIFSILGWIVVRQITRIDELEKQIGSLASDLTTLESKHKGDHTWISDHEKKLAALADTRVKVELLMQGKAVIINPQENHS